MQSKRNTLLFCMLFILTMAFTGCSTKNAETFYGDNIPKGGNTAETNPDETTDDITVTYNLDIPDYSEYVKLGNYKGVVYYIDDSQYTADEEMIDYTILNELELEPVTITDRPSKKGDHLNISYTGTIDGKPFDGNAASNVDMIIGGGTLLPEFEEKMTGFSSGETKTISITYPDTFSDETLAGKQADFDVTVNSIQSYSLDIVTDDIVKEKTDFETLSDYKADVTKNIQKQLDETKKTDAASQILSRILQDSEILGYNDIEVQEMVESAKYVTSTYAQNEGITAEEYVKKEYNYDDYTAYEESLVTMAHNYLDTTMLISTIAHAENIVVTDEEYQSQCQEYMNQYNISAKELSQYYTSEDIIYSKLIIKLYDWLLDNSVKSDNPIDK